MRMLYHVAGFPANVTLNYSVMTNDIRSNPNSRRDVQINNGILGKSKHIAPGKTTMKALDPIDVSNQTAELPPTEMTHYGAVQLIAEVMHVNDVPFLTSTSNHVNYGTSNTVNNMKAPTLEQGIENIIRCYATRGFSAGVMFLDIQFKCTKDRNPLGVTIKIFSICEYMKQIE